MLSRKTIGVRLSFGLDDVALRFLLWLPVSLTKQGHFIFIGQIDLINRVGLTHHAEQNHTSANGSLAHDDPLPVFACPVREFELAIDATVDGIERIIVVELRRSPLMMPAPRLILL